MIASQFCKSLLRPKSELNLCVLCIKNINNVEDEGGRLCFVTNVEQR